MSADERARDAVYNAECERRGDRIQARERVREELSMLGMSSLSFAMSAHLVVMYPEYYTMLRTAPIVFSPEELSKVLGERPELKMIIWDDMPVFWTAPRRAPPEDMAFFGWMCFERWNYPDVYAHEARLRGFKRDSCLYEEGSLSGRRARGGESH